MFSCIYCNEKSDVSKLRGGVEVLSRRKRLTSSQARRISAAENHLREDLSVIESIEANIEIIDVEMGKEPEYLTVGKTPLERVHKLLSKLHSIRISQDRGSMVSKEAELLFNKFVKQVEMVFKNRKIPKSEWVAKKSVDNHEARW